MMLANLRNRLIRVALGAGIAVGAPVLLADDAPEISVLTPDDDLGPIQRLPQTAGSEPEVEWSPQWRQPKPAKSTRTHSAETNDLAPPEIDLPTGTDAPSIESEPAKNASSRKQRFGKSTAAPAKPANERRAARSKPTKAAEATPSTDAPINIDIPGLEPGESIAGGADTSPDPALVDPPKRSFFSRVFRSQATPPSEAPARSARPGWGLFRGVPMSR